MPIWCHSQPDVTNVTTGYVRLLHNEPSYAADRDMEPPPCCYHHTCGIGFGKSAEIMDHSSVSNDTIMQWLRLSSHIA